MSSGSSRVTRELNALSNDDLERRLQDAKNELINIRFGLATRQTENTARIVQVKRQIARLTTILRERELEE